MYKVYSRQVAEWNKKDLEALPMARAQGKKLAIQSMSTRSSFNLRSDQQAIPDRLS